MGKIAILILAHQKFYQLRKLIDKFYCNERFVIFVHLDRRVGNQILQSLKRDYPGVQLIKKRIRINWAGFSMVRATLNSVEEILNCKEIVAVVLLSGESMPCKDVDEIFEEIIQGGKNFIYVDTSYGPTTHKVTYEYSFNDFTLLKAFFSLIDILVKKTNVFSHWSKGSTLYFFQKFTNRILPTRTKLPLALVPYYGHQWWILSSQFLNELIPLYKKNKGKIDRFFKFTHCSDEWFFQTFFKHYYPDYPLGVIRQYSDTQRDGHAKIVRKEDFEKIKKGNFLFARKFDENIFPFSEDN